MSGSVFPPGGLLAGAAFMAWVACAHAQADTAAANAAAPSAAARFVESCRDALARGTAEPGCQQPMRPDMLQQLKSDAITTQNPRLLSFVGEAYEDRRSGMADYSQAYRWYLMAAVRGDARAMQRLAELNRNGMGVAQDKVKALGYARLAEQLGAPGTKAAGGVAQTIKELGSQMATEELALAEKFALEMEAAVKRQAGGQPLLPPVQATTVPFMGAPTQGSDTGRVAPGLPSVPGLGAGAVPAMPQPQPEAGFPGTFNEK